MTITNRPSYGRERDIYIFSSKDHISEGKYNTEIFYLALSERLFVSDLFN